MKTISEPRTQRIGFVLDESGSMRKVLDPTIQGFNQYLTDRQGDAAELGVNVVANVMTFNSRTREVALDAEIAEVDKLSYQNYNPAGYTRLYGTIHQMVQRLEAQTRGKDEDVILVIQTDGQNNIWDYSQEATRKLLEAKQKDGWTVVFLGAGPEGFAEGEALNIPVGNRMRYENTSHEAANAFKLMSRSHSSYSGERARGMAAGAAVNFFAPTVQDQPTEAELEQGVLKPNRKSK